MKTMKKLTALLLCLALLSALAGCGSLSQMGRAVRNMSKLQSYRMDLTTDMELKLSVLGQKMDMDMAIEGSSDVTVKPNRTKSSMRLGLLGQELTVLGYSEKTDTGVVSYSSQDGGQSWTKKTVESKELAAAADKQSFAGLLKLAAGFEKTGVETVRGSEASVYAGVITAADLDSVMEMSDILKNVFEAMNLSAEGLDTADFGSIPVTVAIDNKSNMVVRYTMDLTEFMSRLMPSLVDSILAESAEASGLGGLDLSMLGFSVETGRVFAAVELYDFDAVGEIVIPAEALSAPEAAA